MITINSLSVDFGGVRPLSNLTVELSKPVHGVIGPNGAGKTTLLNVLSGFVVPVSGTMNVDGHDLLAMSARKRARWGLRRTFQTEQLAADLTARENITVMLDSTDGRHRHRAQVDDMCDVLGIVRRDVPVGALDTYERRMTELGRALVGHPKVVLLDEPGAGLSTRESGALANIIRSIPERFGAQVVLIDHDIDMIIDTCEWVAVLDFGQLLANGPTASVLDDDRVKTAYLGTEVTA